MGQRKMESLESLRNDNSDVNEKMEMECISKIHSILSILSRLLIVCSSLSTQLYTPKEALVESSSATKDTEF